MLLFVSSLAWWPSSNAEEPTGEVEQQALAADSDCHDDSTYAESCPLWAQAGECDANPVFMLATCRLSCGCKPVPAEAANRACEDRDKSGSCPVWAAAGECDANPAFMKLKCVRVPCVRLTYALPCSRVDAHVWNVPFGADAPRAAAPATCWTTRSAVRS